MYYSDNFNPNDENELKQLNVSKKYEEESLNQLRKMDKYFFTIVRSELKSGKTFKISYYASKDVGSLIRNAITGKTYNSKFIVGSRAEDLFFKVTIATGETGQDSVNLFYENPEEYENHQRVLLGDAIKTQWVNKYNIAKKIYDI